MKLPKPKTITKLDTLQNGGNMTMMTRRVTLLDLVKAVQDVSGTEEEAVAVLTHMLKKNVRSVQVLPEAA